MIETGNLQLIRQVREHNERRLRLVACVALVGGALGAGAVVISLLNRTKPWLDPDHMDLVPSMILSSAGFVAGGRRRRCSPMSWYTRLKQRGTRRSG